MAKGEYIGFVDGDDWIESNTYEIAINTAIKENADLLSDWSILISAVLLIAMYELGFIINKMGSVIIEPIYRGKKFKKFKRSDDGGA